MVDNELSIPDHLDLELGDGDGDDGWLNGNGMRWAGVGSFNFSCHRDMS